jgi:hypothetical protein
MVKNYQIFKENMNYLIQNSGLDIGAVYFILKDTLKEVESFYFSQINSELMKEKEEKVQEVKATPLEEDKEN